MQPNLLWSLPEHGYPGGVRVPEHLSVRGGGDPSQPALHPPHGEDWAQLHPQRLLHCRGHLMSAHDHWIGNRKCVHVGIMI